MRHSTMKTFLRICGTLLFLSTPAFGQINTVQAQAEAALVNGNPALAADLTAQLLETNPNDSAALFILALAQADLGDLRQSAVTAGLAYRTAPTERSRLQAAQLAGGARFSLKQYARAELWLRRAANHITTEQEAETVVRAFQRAQQANPLSLQFGAQITPSDNINGGSESETFRLEGIDIDFFLPPERLALSGTEYSASAQASYRLSQSAVQMTSVGGFLFGRTFTLSPETQEAIPDLSGSDLSQIFAEVSLTHRRQIFDDVGPTLVSLGFGRIWYGGEPYSEYRSFSLDQVFPISSDAQLRIGGGIKDQTALVPQFSTVPGFDPTDSVPLGDPIIYDLRGTYARTLANNDGLQLSLSAAVSDGGFENTFTEYRGRINYKIAKPIWDTRFSFSFELGHKSYDEFTISLDGRRDVFATFGATAVFEKISYFGFSPSATISATRTESDVDIFTSSQIQAGIGAESNF